MAAERKVFLSEIERGQKPLQNNLYDLLDFNAVKPSSIEINETNLLNDFKPRSDKLYVPKKRSISTKVKTVRHIRNDYEKFVKSYLPDDITKQEKVLFNRIRCGSSRNVKTINLARKLLANKLPISRSSWQMLTNLNPNKNANPIQHVLWNGKRIRVTGSLGGEKKFLCNFDLGKKIHSFKKPSLKKYANHKCSLLKTSLAVDFKPGPLSRKTELDNSYQKKYVGTTKLVTLPKIGLDVEPSFGVPLEPTISNILHTLREENGKMTNKWAFFAVSTLASIENSEVLQCNKDTVTFDLNFKNHQNNILMRHDEIKNTNANIDIKLHNNVLVEDDTIRNMVFDMIKAVEISLTQEELFEVDSSNSTPLNDIEFVNNSTISKVKPKNKFTELEKLDVTVIRISESFESEKTTIPCKNSFCNLGCICNSLESRFNFKKHCGRIDCMFECQCDFSKYKSFSALNSQCAELIPGLLNYDDKISSKLTKEEKKFHQTVVFTEDNNSIVLKAQRRHLKTPKRYTEHFNNINLKNEYNKKFLCISITKLNCSNVETWCMVHNLYQCFCKGRYVECTLAETEKEPVIIPMETTKEESVVVELPFDNGNKNITKSFNENSMKLRDRASKLLAAKINSSETKHDTDEYDSDSFDNYTSARTQPFEKRRFHDTYYAETNRKIKEMEQNDISLHAKLMSYIVIKDGSVNSNEPEALLETSDNANKITDFVTIEDETSSDVKNYSPKCFENKSKLVTWLEANYKRYKERLEKGNNRIILEAPTPGKFALYPWEVILDRYLNRKNYFVVTKEEPYRIFVAVDLNKPFFNNCINISCLNIRDDDKKKYPVTVSNLINKVPTLKDNFYIMCGMLDCWELIGSVTKLRDKNKADEQLTASPPLLNIKQIDNSDQKAINFEGDSGKKINVEGNIVDDYSKWFAMILEDDFDEIQFHTRGFFVKYTNIIKAINVARASAKTVRLSSQKSSKDDDFPRFGIYALPVLDEIRVYIGPYNKDDVLGIDTLKTSVNTNLRLNEKKSRGVWMTIKAVENVKVIDEPLSFLPDIAKSSEIIFLNNDSMAIDNIVSSSTESSSSCSENEQRNKQTQKLTSLNTDISVKVLKPIKINKVHTYNPKTSLFSLLKSPVKSSDEIHNSFVLSSQALNSNTKGIPVIKDIFSLSTAINANENNTPELLKIRPVAEIAPQQKENSSSFTATVEKSKLGGMFVLKPEEINNRLSQNMIFTNQNPHAIKNETITRESDKDERPYMDIENFLATSEICAAPNIADVYEVSDDDDMSNKEPKEIWIECVNIDNLGFIKGKRNSENKVSFEFPGFKYTEFYDEEEAFIKINQVLSRKVYVPKQIHVQWNIVDSKDNLKNKEMLSASSLGPNFILTKRGLQFKSYVLKLNNQGTRTTFLSTSKDQIQVQKNPDDLKRSNDSPTMGKDTKRYKKNETESENVLLLTVKDGESHQTEEIKARND